MPIAILMKEFMEVDNFSEKKSALIKKRLIFIEKTLFFGIKKYECVNEYLKFRAK